MKKAHPLASSFQLGDNIAPFYTLKIDPGNALAPYPPCTYDHSFLGHKGCPAGLACAN